MSYYSEYYLEEFQNDAIKKLTIILNRVEMHSKQKYLLIVAKDSDSNKIVKLIDNHGTKHDLCKYSEDWAKLSKGDIISVKCEFYKSPHCANVLRIKSNYTLIESTNLHKAFKKLEDALLKKEELIFDPEKGYYLSTVEYHSDMIMMRQMEEKYKYFTMKYRPDLYFLSKKLSGKYGFVLYYLIGGKLIKFKGNNTNKVKYQFALGLYHLPCYADIEFYIPDIDKQVGQSYTGFVLLQFAYKNDRIRAKIYDLLDDKKCFEYYNQFGLAQNCKTGKAIYLLGEDDVLSDSHHTNTYEI